MSDSYFGNVRGVFFLVTGFIACPCHLPLTLPLVAALFVGTALGAFLLNNVWLIVAISSAYFVGALALGLRYLSQNDKPWPSEETKHGGLQNGKSI